MKKNIFLGFDTASDTFSVALGRGGEIISGASVPGRRHSDKLVPTVDSLLKENGFLPEDIKAVGMGTGPGSFTGIRVGLSFGITFAQFFDIPAYGLSSMDLAGSGGGSFMLKAFRDKVYWADYDKTGRSREGFKIKSRSEAENLNARELKISAEPLVQKTASLYEAGAEGDWRKIEPIYAMQTAYKKKDERA